MSNEVAYWILFIVRVILFAIVLEKYGGKASLLTLLYTIATAIGWELG